MLSPSPLTLQSTARFCALAYRSVPLSVCTSARARSETLALRVREFKPGVYCVAASVIDTWRGSCSCLAWRSVRGSTRRPCVHMLAVWLATGLEAWSPATRWQIAWSASHGIDQPEMDGWTCQLRGRSGTYEYIRPCLGGARHLFRPIGGYELIMARVEDVTHLHPYYSEVQS